MMGKYIIGPWGRLLRQPGFIICTAILLLCAVGLHAGAKRLKVYLSKEAVPLQKPLSELERADLGPYQVEKKFTIDKETELELGTTEYISWFIKDTSVSESDPAHNLYLFIAYYTGDPGAVPHVPEICGDANGGRIYNDENTEVTVPGCGLEDAENRLPLRIVDVEMLRENQRTQRTVAYFFSVNGDYRCMRNQIRWRANSPWDRYAYFCKVEISLTGPDKLSRDEALAAMEKLCRVLVPILWSEYWPDWPSLPQR